AYDLLRSAAAASDPCVVFEARGLYQTTGPVQTAKAVEGIGKARLHKEGKDAVILTWGTMLKPALDAAELLEKEKRHVAVLDLRWLSPVDEAAVLSAVKAAGGRVVVAHEANSTGGFGAEIVARLHEKAGIPLKVVRVATPDMRVPAAPVLMRELVPSADRIAEAVSGLLK
ncbi:MAG: transketolase C-terminal domain-containing protein, partial [Candidatus Korobacteraceae bacterium]